MNYWSRLGVGGLLLIAALGWWNPARVQAEFYGDITTKRFHAAECPETPLIKKKNLKKYDSEAEARAKGFYPCPLCNTAVRKDVTAVVSHRILSQAVSRADGYMVDKTAHIYHQIWCPQVKKADARQMVKVPNIEKASANGNSPCAVCNPPVAFVRAVTVSGNLEKAGTKLPPQAPASSGGNTLTPAKE